MKRKVRGALERALEEEASEENFAKRCNDLPPVERGEGRRGEERGERGGRGWRGDDREEERKMGGGVEERRQRRERDGREKERWGGDERGERGGVREAGKKGWNGE